MSKIAYQALREKAEKATCGVWSLEYGEERFDAGDALIHREVVGYLPICRIEGAHPESGFDEDFQIEQQANAEFIAAANPATVLAMLDELEDAERQILKLEKLAEAESAGADKSAASCVEWMKRCHAAEKRIAELEAREISLPERSSMLHRTDFHDDYQTVMAYKVSEVIDAIRAAGIRIKGE
ncbi:ead/Ea22-like family protein [Escherichia coli]|uniref:ead/Ea22-like family protein n=1 Tax=Escherichia coli TaxID=562 RepID=UPI0013D5C80D|nr:ead/Ea22-like family protein [Escherichia coli]EFQ2936549.1 ead/Ea22-like family protein [Escherichia coli]EHZ4760530.1 ead/Ea22-like family protein [Escherichia coli]EIH9207335.1 ead/Ea22-like family protein [Escherichia coli]MDI1173191.1 ead/Ea22-like family protein [Escherichia coli]NGA56242.1 ead/Ea22-like family protein [Escherichia coli]